MKKLNDKLVTVILYEYDELPFSRLPPRIKTYLRNNNMSFGPRMPTPSEIKETHNDAYEHRINNREETIDDILYQLTGESHVRL